MKSAARRTLLCSGSLARYNALAGPRTLVAATARCRVRRHLQARHLANVSEDALDQRSDFFSTTPFRHGGTGSGGHQGGARPPDRRTLQLGKTVSVLREHLPTLLASPPPSEILSPQITLHLFPSTHPHLPTVSGRLAYLAALWTAPVAWGRVPVVGNIRLDIVSERMVKNGSSGSGFRSEKFIVRWKTCGKVSKKGGNGQGDQVQKIKEVLSADDQTDSDEFAGIFVFEFDEEGRILKHTIEHAEEGGNFEKMTRVVNVTDWLIGLAKGKKSQEEHGLALGYCKASHDSLQHEYSNRLRRTRRRGGPA